MTGMTQAPPQQTSLGDFIQVQLNPNLPIPIINGVPGKMVTIANQDLTQTVTIARRNNFTQNGPNALPIPPLGAVTIDMSKTIYGLAPAGTLPVIVLTGGGQWAPAPSQIAASISALGLATAANQTTQTSAINNPSYNPITQTNSGLLSTLAQQVTQQTAIPNNIAATGVPLLVLPNTLVNVSNTSVASGGSTALTAVNPTQPGYNILVQAHSTAGTATYARVLMTWTDAVTGNVVNRQSWWFIPGADATTNQHSIAGSGPTEGTQLTITLFAYNNTVVFDLVFLEQNSRIYARHDWRTYAVANLAGGLNVSNADMSGMIMGQFNQSVVTTGHFTAYTCLFAGKVSIWCHSASNTTDMTLQINALADQVALSPGIIAEFSSDSGGNINVQQFYLPRSMCQWILTNNNAATKTLTFNVTMGDQ